MEELVEYLRSRHVEEEAIQQMEQDKIDTSVIKLMSDEELKVYLPSYGDRIAVFGHCRRQEEPSSRKSKLFERLKEKLTKKQTDNATATTGPASAKRGRKNDRKIELGWLHFRDKENMYVHMRTKKGGGTRKESVSKKSTNKNLIERALELFFPGGENVQGRSSDFEVDLTDFQETPLAEDVTVEEMYSKTKLPMLRFYLKTKKKQMGTVSNLVASSAESPNLDDVPPQASSSSNSTVVSMNNMDVIYIETFETTEPFEGGASLFHSLQEQETTVDLIDLDDSGIVTLRPAGHLEIEPSTLDDTLPIAEEELPTFLNVPEIKRTIIVVHRGQILQELIQVFREDEIMNKEDVCFKVILPDGKVEKAVDDGGVLRDVLTEFWEDFYEQCTMGSDFKVPYLRHDFGKEEWESVGRIIAFGWKQAKHLPIKLAPVILEQAILGAVESSLLDSFLKYVSSSERVMFQTCCSDFESIDNEELIEVLDLHNCRRNPTESNIDQILRELAHQKLIQEPAFVIEQWSNVLVGMKSELKGIAAIYEELQPTSRKIMKSLTYPANPNATEKQIIKYVTAYLRECDMCHLSSFLRFCTGSDVFTGKDITVSFTKINGFQRRPIAHTCGCYLELPVTYESYPDFRHEMNKVLESNIWVMDLA